MDPIAAPAFMAGFLFAWLVGQAYYPFALRSTEPEDKQPAPPPAEPERDPGWCHSHGMHRDEEEG